MFIPDVCRFRRRGVDDKEILTGEVFDIFNRDCDVSTYLRNTNNIFENHASVADSQVSLVLPSTDIHPCMKPS
jgi:hypothetical protein